MLEFNGGREGIVLLTLVIVVNLIVVNEKFYFRIGLNDIVDNIIVSELVVWHLFPR